MSIGHWELGIKLRNPAFYSLYRHPSPLFWRGKEGEVPNIFNLTKTAIFKKLNTFKNVFFLDLIAYILLQSSLLPITNYQLPISNYQLPITNYQLPMPSALFDKFI